MAKISGKVDLQILKNIAAEYQGVSSLLQLRSAIALNGHHVEVVDDITPVEFLRKVHIGRPVLIKGFVIPATEKWNEDYLIHRMGEDKISIAITPDGNADAIVATEGGKEYFAEPHTEAMTTREFLRRLHSSSEVHYLQSQNGNLYSSSSESVSEFERLHTDIPKDISWASEALGTSPDAVNIWIGNGRSVTSIHSDPYENIYTVVRGAKHFVLFPPTEAWCMRERLYPHAQYKRKSPEDALRLIPSDSTTPDVRWSSIKDPMNAAELPPEARPLHITLQPGETLYLPAGWWHHVRQSDLTIALNWWYDMEARGMGWVWLNFLRGETGSLLSEDD